MIYNFSCGEVIKVLQIPIRVETDYITQPVNPSPPAQHTIPIQIQNINRKPITEPEPDPVEAKSKLVHTETKHATVEKPGVVGTNPVKMETKISEVGSESRKLIKEEIVRKEVIVSDGAAAKIPSGKDSNTKQSTNEGK